MPSLHNITLKKSTKNPHNLQFYFKKIQFNRNSYKRNKNKNNAQEQCR